MIEDTITALAKRNVKVSISNGLTSRGDVRYKADVKLDSYKIGPTWPKFEFSIVNDTLDGLAGDINERMTICEPIIKASELHLAHQSAVVLADGLGKDLYQACHGDADAVGAEEVEPNTNAATALEQPIKIVPKGTPKFVNLEPGTTEYAIQIGRLAMMNGGYVACVGSGILTADEARFANGLPPLAKAA